MGGCEGVAVARRGIEGSAGRGGSPFGGGRCVCLALLTSPRIAGALCVVEDGFDGGGVVLGEVGLELLEFLDIGGEFCEQGAAVG